MNFLIPIICAILYRLDGWGKGDSFLPCKPFTFPNWKTGGINYTRYAIGPVVALFTHNPWFILTYTIAVSIPYGEDHWWMKYGLWSWAFIGWIFGAASMDFYFASWFACVVVVAKKIDLDHSLFEFLIMGFIGTVIHIFN